MARYFLIFVLIAATGCEKLRQGVVRDIQFPEHESQLAITTRIREGDSVLVASVYQSASILDPAGSIPASDAVVTVTWAGAEQWAWNGSDGMLISNVEAGWDWETGEEVLLSAEAPNLPAAAARAVVPPQAEGLAVETIGADTLISPWMPEPMVEDHVVLDLVNHPGADDWYLVQVEEFSDLGGWISKWAEPDLATGERLVFNLFAQGFLVDDLGLDETPLDGFRFIRTRFPEDLAQPQRIRISSLSEALYQHFVSLEANAFSEGNPFAEPASVFGNVEGGFGVMGLMREHIIEL